MKSHRLQLTLGGLFAASIALSTIHPLGDPRAGAQSAAIFQGADLPPRVRAELESKCGDCHSQNTRYPLYSHFAPVTWIIDRDVREGRHSLDFSRWQSYTPDERINALTRMASQVHAGQMPPRMYVLLHPHAHLSQQDQTFIYDWAKSERRRLRSHFACASDQASAASRPPQP